MDENDMNFQQKFRRHITPILELLFIPIRKLIDMADSILHFRKKPDENNSYSSMSITSHSLKLGWPKRKLYREEQDEQKEIEEFELSQKEKHVQFAPEKEIAVVYEDDDDSNYLGDISDADQTPTQTPSTSPIPTHELWPETETYPNRMKTQIWLNKNYSYYSAYNV